MREQIKAALSQKIDTKEKFDTFLREHRIHIKGTDSYYIGEHENSGIGFPAVRGFGYRGVMSIDPTHWWWVREFLRDYYGVYMPADTSTVVRGLLDNSFTRPYYPHISTTDPTRIAVTMSPEDGVRDKQTTIALGRWLRKMYPTATDAQIQKWEAIHRADMTNELEIVRTAEDIERVYTTMRGDSGCMRHEKGHWNLPHHPSVVYSSPGFGVAVVRDSEGTPVARAVVYENPADPGDKRYVRVYGDLVIKRRLERNGYTLAGTGGTVMDAHAAGEGYEDSYILPYLDPPGGGASGVTRHRHYGVALKDGKLHILDESTLNRISTAMRGRNESMDSYIASGSTQSGRVYLRPLPEDLFTWLCVVTGQTHNLDDSTPVKVWHNGAIGQAHLDVVAGWVYVKAFVEAHGRVQVAYAPADTPTFTNYGDTWLDNEVTRRRCGFARLDAQLYPGPRDWVRAETTASLSDDRVILRSDSVVVNTTDGVNWVHKDEIQEGWVRLHRSSRYPDVAVYSKPDAAHGITRSKAKVGLHTHETTLLHDGSIEYTRNCKRVALYGIGDSVTVHKDTTRAEIVEISKAKAVQMCAVWLDGKNPGYVPGQDVEHKLVARLVNATWVPTWSAALNRFMSTLITDLDSPVADALAALEAWAAQPEEVRAGHAINRYYYDDALAVSIASLRHLKERLEQLHPEEINLSEATPADNERFVVAN